MKIFVAGATGAVGKRLVPMLVAAGHHVVGTTRTPEKADSLRKLGAEAVVVDGLDREAMVQAIVDAEPEVVVHEMTALAGFENFRRFEREFAETNRLRSEGTDNVIAGAQAAGVRRIVAQSFAGWPYGTQGSRVKDEDAPLYENPPKAFRPALEAIKHLEHAVLNAEGIEGVVLRYGGLYGPGTSLEPGGPHLEAVKQRKFPVVGSGGGIWSFVHVDDAASATAAACERGAPGIYNVVDDEPATVAEWLPALAEVAGAKPPRRVPTWVGRLAVGEHGVMMMTEIRGASNAKAKRELGWRPVYRSWREGFRSVLASPNGSAPAPTPAVVRR